jgi:hypothetical protein
MQMHVGESGRRTRRTKTAFLRSTSYPALGRRVLVSMAGRSGQTSGWETEQSARLGDAALWVAGWVLGD